MTENGSRRAAQWLDTRAVDVSHGARVMMRRLMHLVCLVLGHDTKHRMATYGRTSAIVLNIQNAKVMSRCNRCWDHVSHKR